MLLRLLLELDPVEAARIETLLPAEGLHVERRASDGSDPTAPHDLVISRALPLTRTQPGTDDLRAGSALSSAPVVVLCEGLDVAQHATLLADGAYAVMAIDTPDADLRGALATLITRRRADLEALLVGPPEIHDPQGFVARSPALERLLELVERVAQARTPVLVLGETGVGKERIASLLHAKSPRREGPFVAINCAAIPAELTASELFGHARGAFTGASTNRRGYFELAHGGTLFLDEIGEIPLDQQSALLRVLQEGRLRPVGSERELSVDVRVVAATHRDLAAEVEAGRFRRDLYFRISVMELEVPPLRERPEDLDALIDLQLARLRVSLGRQVERIHPKARAALLRYRWPGNVRELLNVLERAMLLCLGDELTLEDLPRAIAGDRELDPAPRSGVGVGPLPEAAWIDMPWKAAREELLRQGERAYLVHLLRSAGGRIGVAARQAGIAERSLFEKLKRHGLRKEDFKHPG